MLGQPLSMLLPRVVGIELVGALPAGLDRDRPRAHRRRAAAQARRGRQVRRVLRRGRRPRAAREPGDDRQHVARVRLDVHDLPGRRRDAALPPRDRPARRSRRARRDVREGAGALARPRRPARVRRDDLVRPLDGRAVARRPGAPAGPRVAVGARSSFEQALLAFRREETRRATPRSARRAKADEASIESFPASDPPAPAPSAPRTRSRRRGEDAAAAARSQALPGDARRRPQRSSSPTATS